MMYFCSMVTKSKNIEILVPSFDGTNVIGINSTLVDYKLAWSLNSKLSLDLTRKDDFEQNDGIFPFYSYQASKNSPIYNLVANTCVDKTILTLSPRVDFLFLIRNEQFPQRIETILQKIREIEGIGYAFLIEGQKQKMEQTLYSLEQHEVEIERKAKERNSIEYIKKDRQRREYYLGMRSDCPSMD